MTRVFPLLLLFIFSCTAVNNTHEGVGFSNLSTGPWLFRLNIGETIIPFNATINLNDGKPVFVIYNGSEEIRVDAFTLDRDSFSMTLPVFGSTLRGKLTSDSTLEGFWYNASRGPDYKIPFTAIQGNYRRFVGVKQENTQNFDGKWEVHFNPNEADPCNAIGVFHQSDNQVTGTFLTEMGDYRFLEGSVYGDTMKLSCFDGSHAFLFSAFMKEDGTIDGRFWSGNHWKETWVARRNENYHLIHPDSLTLIKEGASEFDFNFPDLNGNPVSFQDDRFRNKVVIVQLMGSWCPNCADEAYLLTEFNNRFKDSGLEIVAIAYEKFDDKDKALASIRHFIDGTGANYEFLYGGKASKQKASEDFSMTSGVTSFPTAFFIDRQGKIRKIHTGFYGPGTGAYYIDYKEDLELFVEKLLREKEEVSS